MATAEANQAEVADTMAPLFDNRITTSPVSTSTIDNSLSTPQSPLTGAANNQILERKMDSDTVVIYYQIKGRTLCKIKIDKGMDLVDLRKMIVNESKLIDAPDMLFFSATNTDGAKIPINDYYFEDECQSSFKKLISLINISVKNPILVTIGRTVTPPVTAWNPQEDVYFSASHDTFHGYSTSQEEFMKAYKDKYKELDVKDIQITQSY